MPSPGFAQKFHDAKGKVGPVCITVTTAIFMIVPISMIAMGAVYLNRCPAERYIPIYLVVFGAFSCFLLLIRMMETWRQDEDGNAPIVFKVIAFLVGIFLLAWFIAGNVWIYRLYNNYSTVATAVNYCNNTLYLYAFWVTTLTYILLAICLLLCCSICICLVCCCGAKQVQNG